MPSIPQIAPIRNIAATVGHHANVHQIAAAVAALATLTADALESKAAPATATAKKAK